MTTERDKRFLKIFIPIIIFLSIIYIFKSGYGTGQWLHNLFNK